MTASLATVARAQPRRSPLPLGPLVASLVVAATLLLEGCGRSTQSTSGSVVPQRPTPLTTVTSVRTGIGTAPAITSIVAALPVGCRNAPYALLARLIRKEQQRMTAPPLDGGATSLQPVEKVRGETTELAALKSWIPANGAGLDVPARCIPQVVAIVDHALADRRHQLLLTRPADRTAEVAGHLLAIVNLGKGLFDFANDNSQAYAAAGLVVPTFDRISSAQGVPEGWSQNAAVPRRGVVVA